MFRALAHRCSRHKDIALRSIQASDLLASTSCPSSLLTSEQIPSALARYSSNSKNGQTQWELLRSEGFNINPCNSKLHPAVMDGSIEPDNEDELAVQEAYTPESTCFGCGPAAPDGLHLRSYRVPGGLEAQVTIDRKYCAFPGIVNGGIISALFDCHGNWTSAISLMDKGFVPNPPLTLTKELLVTFKEPTPPDEPLIVRSQIVSIHEGSDVGKKATVQVDLSLYLAVTGKLLVTATGIFKKAGALRAL